MTVHLSPAEAASAVLAFWFGEVGKQRWFVKAPDLDREIFRRFGGWREAVLTSGAKAWRDRPDHLLAAIVLLDQFSRNIHRGSARAFDGDALARELTYLALDRGWDQVMTADQRQFLLMPLMHSEKLADQQRALGEYGKLGDSNAFDFARLHHDQIARFGRFPGRNAAFGRRTTEAEQAALDGGAAF